MKSIISKSIGKDWQEYVSIGNMAHLNKVRQQCMQLVCVLQWNHNESDWEYINSLTQEELLFALQKAIEKNPLHVLYLN